MLGGNLEERYVVGESDNDKMLESWVSHHAKTHISISISSAMSPHPSSIRCVQQWRSHEIVYWLS
jgi:hypothetical protein